MRKYASKQKLMTKMTFEMIEQILEPIRPGRYIKIWIRRKPSKYGDSEYRIVQGKIKAVYPHMVLILVKARKNVYYNECFLKADLARYKFEIN